MTSIENDRKTNSESQTELKCLEPLLQQSLKSKELQVLYTSITKLLPPGENYASIMLKIDLSIRKNKSTNEEILHLVAKTPTRSGISIVEWPLVFKKELFMYVELAPLYRQLEREFGINECELIDIWPKYIGHRNSLKNDGSIDDDSLLLMENLKFKDFYMVNRRVGMDIHHARKAITSLARYHALGIVMLEKRPLFAKKAVDEARILGIHFEHLNDGYDKLLKTFREEPSLQKHLSVIESSFEQIKNGNYRREEAPKPWATITHGDFWMNNILFHKDDQGNIDDVKFVDFQMYLYNSPLKDVHYFLCGSLDKETQTDYLNELIDLYYNTFLETLKRMKCNISLYTRKNFDLEFKKQAINEFPFLAIAIKVFKFEMGDNSNSYGEFDHILNARADDDYIDTLRWLLEIYEKLGWF